MRCSYRCFAGHSSHIFFFFCACRLRFIMRINMGQWVFRCQRPQSCWCMCVCITAEVCSPARWYINKSRFLGGGEYAGMPAQLLWVLAVIRWYLNWWWKSTTQTAVRWVHGCITSEMWVPARWFVTGNYLEGVVCWNVNWEGEYVGMSSSNNGNPLRFEFDRWSRRVWRVRGGTQGLPQ